MQDVSRAIPMSERRFRAEQLVAAVSLSIAGTCAAAIIVLKVTTRRIERAVTLPAGVPVPPRLWALLRRAADTDVVYRLQCAAWTLAIPVATLTTLRVLDALHAMPAFLPTAVGR